MANTNLTRIKNALARAINLNDYEGVGIGSCIEIKEGDFIVTERPNLYQPIDKRFWVFEQCTGEDGEPIMGEVLIRIKC